MQIWREGGIRTHGRFEPTPDYESGTFDHSATSPSKRHSTSLWILYLTNWTDGVGDLFHENGYWRKFLVGLANSDRAQRIALPLRQAHLQRTATSMLREFAVILFASTQRDGCSAKRTVCNDRDISQ